MKNVCIVFNGGSYGTFIEWCLNYFSDLDFPMELPFNKKGNSHKFIGNHLLNFNGCQQYIDSNLNFPFVRYHLRTYQFEDTLGNFQFTYNNFNYVVYLHCTSNSIVWNINNKFEKIWDQEWITVQKDLIQNNLKQWGNDKTFENIEPWEIREFLSYFIYDQHIAESDLNNINTFKIKFPNAIFAEIESLRDNFEYTLRMILTKLNLPIVRTNFLEIYNYWIESQYHIYKDQLISDIVNSVISNKYIEYNNLTLVDEALIQYFLRKHGIEIKCYSLNQFPTNTHELKNYLKYD